MRKLSAPIIVALFVSAGCGGQIQPGDSTDVSEQPANAETAAAPGTVESGDETAAEVGGGVASVELAPGDGTVGIDALLVWWHSRITWDHWTSFGWDDTDLAVSSSTAVQLRHASKLVAYGTYAWGYMPTFVDQVTGHKFKFLHLRPQHERATQIGHVYPAGYVVGYSGGDTWDTGGAGRGYSTGPHLCVQTLVGFRKAFPW